MLNLAQAKIFYIISKPSNRVASKRSNVALLSRRLRGNVHFGRILLLSIHLFCYISYLSRSVRKRVFLPIHSTREAGAALQLSSEQQTAAAELPFPSSSSSSLPDRLLPDRRRSMPKATAAASYIWGWNCCCCRSVSLNSGWRRLRLRPWRRPSSLTTTSPGGGEEQSKRELDSKLRSVFYANYNNCLTDFLFTNTSFFRRHAIKNAKDIVLKNLGMKKVR